MWRLYTTAKATRGRPSDLVCVEDRWAAYQFDAAVSFFGVAVENAAQEQVNIGGEDTPKWTNRYTLAELLTPGFVIGDGGGDGGDELPVGADGLIYDEVK